MNQKKIRISELIVVLISLITLFLNVGSNGFFYILKTLFIIFLLSIPHIVVRLFKVEIDTKVRFVYVIYIFLAYYFGVILEWYLKVDLYDKLIHFIFGLVFAYISYEVVLKNLIEDYLINSVLILLINLSTSALWEILEFTIDKVTGSDTQRVKTGVDDTMLDIIFALIGALVYIIIKKMRKKDK